MANYNYYLGPWIWDASDAAMPCWRGPDGTVGGVDLASLTDLASAIGAPRKLAFFACSSLLPSEYILLGQGDCRSIQSTNAMRSAWKSATGYNPQGDLLIDLLWDQLTNGADPLGQTAVKPLMPNADGWIDLWLPGHSRIRGERFEWGRPGSRGGNHTGRIKQLLQAEFAALWAANQTQARKVLDFWCGKYQIDTWQEFVPPGLLKDVPGRLPHSTVITDDFNRANSTGLGTASGGFTYSAVGGTQANVFSNQCAIQDGGNRTRADFDLSSADHYSQFDGVSGLTVNAPDCRFSSSANTQYQYNYRGDSGTVHALFKIVAASATLLTSATSPAFTATDTVQISANGSTITGSTQGVARLTATDTAITGNLRCGFSGSNGQVIDNFQAGDLAASGILYTQLERTTRGYARGVYSGSN